MPDRFHHVLDLEFRRFLDRLSPTHVETRFCDPLKMSRPSSQFARDDADVLFKIRFVIDPIYDIPLQSFLRMDRTIGYHPFHGTPKTDDLRERIAGGRIVGDPDRVPCWEEARSILANSHIGTERHSQSGAGGDAVDCRKNWLRHTG